MKKKYVSEVLRYKEKSFLLGGVFADVGFKQKKVFVKKGFKKSTTYNLNKKISQFIDSVTSFSFKPLLLISYFGFFVSMISFLYIVNIVAKKVFFGNSITGWSSLIVSVWFLGGVIIMSIGIVGIYLSKVFLEVKNRPFSVVRKIFKREDG
jgi:putative glycosyltransferase